MVPANAPIKCCGLGQGPFMLFRFTQLSYGGLSKCEWPQCWILGIARLEKSDNGAVTLHTAEILFPLVEVIKIPKSNTGLMNAKSLPWADFTPVRSTLDA